MLYACQRACMELGIITNMLGDTRICVCACARCVEMRAYLVRTIRVTYNTHTHTHDEPETLGPRTARDLSSPNAPHGGSRRRSASHLRQSARAHTHGHQRVAAAPNEVSHTDMLLLLYICCESKWRGRANKCIFGLYLFLIIRCESEHACRVGCWCSFIFVWLLVEFVQASEAATSLASSSWSPLKFEYYTPLLTWRGDVRVGFHIAVH